MRPSSSIWPAFSWSVQVFRSAYPPGAARKPPQWLKAGDVVRVEIDLPWIMQLLRDTVAKRVRGRGVALLEKPQGEA